MGLPENPPEYYQEGAVCEWCGEEFSDDYADDEFEELEDGRWVCPLCYKRWEDYYAN